MSALAQRKTRLVFETEDFVFERGRQRQVIVEARPAYAMVRLKGARKAFSICYAAVYQLACKIEADEERRRKQPAKKARSK